jgi:regulator of sigma E protease
MSDFLIFIVVIASLIFGHELGHFVAARARKVRVDEFGLGFPPRLVTLFTAGGTRFTLNAIPLGGFVRPAGEDDPSIPGGLAGSSKITRALVLLAGPGANILLAFLAFTAAMKFAAPDFERTTISALAPASPAESAGLQPGDVIVSVDGLPIAGYPTLQQAVTDRLGQTLTMGIERVGRSLFVELVPRTEPPEGQGPIGILTGNPRRATTWGESLQYGAQSIAFQVNELIHLPARLLKQEIAPEQARLSGLKGMYDMLSWAGEIDRTAQRPFLTLNLVGVISLGLALANLLPIPALDGGRLVFVLIEAVARRRISPRYEGLAHAIGFALLLALMLYVNLQDFINPISLPR